jgi:phage shock protein PspC (stress-responsive transcriptional regulator)|tara:strand:- start:1561 stop:1758 length:198 start_codon:yes stop_codon:yes gene_type:complete
MKNKLYRGCGYIGGVCKGLGSWSGIPSILWRLIFLFVVPGALCVYIGLWIFVKKKPLNDFQNEEE